MTPEERSLLERTYKLAEENNAILLTLRRAHRIGTGLRIAYWVVIIGISVGAFYLVQPVLDPLLNIYGGGLNNTQDAAGLIQDLLK